jgi:hypothetical protein
MDSRKYHQFIRSNGYPLPILFGGLLFSISGFSCAPSYSEELSGNYQASSIEFDHDECGMESAIKGMDDYSLNLGSDFSKTHALALCDLESVDNVEECRISYSEEVLAMAEEDIWGTVCGSHECSFDCDYDYDFPRFECGFSYDAVLVSPQVLHFDKWKDDVDWSQLCRDVDYSSSPIELTATNIISEVEGLFIDESHFVLQEVVSIHCLPPSNGTYGRVCSSSFVSMFERSKN